MLCASTVVNCWEKIRQASFRVVHTLSVPRSILWPKHRERHCEQMYVRIFLCQSCVIISFEATLHNIGWQQYSPACCRSQLIMRHLRTLGFSVFVYCVIRPMISTSAKQLRTPSPIMGADWMRFGSMPKSGVSWQQSLLQYLSLACT